MVKDKKGSKINILGFLSFVIFLLILIVDLAIGYILWRDVLSEVKDSDQVQSSSPIKTLPYLDVDAYELYNRDRQQRDQYQSNIEGSYTSELEIYDLLQPPNPF